ncbi:hypothetical protein [Lacrimispora sp. 210928-DFI.3.58]|uniref:hypothetical protein n=1 Tax=Lacrimispora sp. 210928-DFI.3.58 TaxID=2883214 RepID=UPI001D06B36C|nr:hypothetical protein [Lacrimispora sp. 210928-DFI.3.58]MCB7320078.1 hypothetical protein [Lacrimispora sp. 210928-DFI.3.58]
MKMMKRVMARNEIIKILICIVSVLNLAIFIFSSDNFYNLGFFSLSARMLLIVNMLIFMCLVTKRIFECRVFYTLVLLILMIFAAYFSFLMHPYGSRMDFIILLAGYLAVPIYILVIPEIDTTDSLRNWFKGISLFYALFFIYCGFLRPTYRKGTNALMLGYSNSNRTGAYILLTVVLMIILFSREEKRWIKVSIWMVEVSLMYLMILTQSRTAFLIALACLLYSVISRAPQIGKKFSIFCILFPAAFLILYVFIYRQGWLLHTTILGRTIYSGRQYTFIAEAQSISAFGNYALGQFAGLNYVQAVLNTLGVMGIGLCWFYYIRFFSSEFLDNCDSGFSKNLSRFCFSVLMLHGCTETSFFTGGTVYAGMIGCILLAMSMNRSIENEEL